MSGSDAKQKGRRSSLAKIFGRNSTAKSSTLRTVHPKDKPVSAETKRGVKQWTTGINPVNYPTPTEVTDARQRLHYDDHKLHIAVTGYTGVGKSSLLNALRGVAFRKSGTSKDAAPTGITETTLTIARYPDPLHKQLAWFDVPGAGTLTIPGWQYFNNQGLFAFDSIIVAFSDRFTEVDVAIMRNCAQYKIPCYLVRTKSDIQINNLIRYNREDDDEDTVNESGDSALLKRCRDEYRKISTENVSRNLQVAEIPQQRVYHVSEDVLRFRVRRKSPPSWCREYELDEKDLLKDLVRENILRRYYHNSAALAALGLIGQLFS